MQISISQRSFADAISAVLQVVPTRTTLPILGNVLISAESNMLQISGTDLSVGIRTSVAADVQRPGTMTIPGRRLSEIVRALSEDKPIQLTVEGYQITIESGRTVFRLTGIDAEEYPNFPEIKGQQKVEMASDGFFRLVNKTAYSVSNDEMRPTLNGVYWKVQPEEMIMVATDGHRLSKISQKLQADDVSIKGTASIGVIIPPKALNFSQKLFSAQDRLTCYLDANFIIFQAGDSYLYSRLIEGTYVNYEQVIPASNSKILRINRNELGRSLRRVLIVADPLTHQVRFILNGDILKIHAENAELGEADEEVVAEFNEEEMHIAYNAQYLLDILNHIDDENVIFKLSSSVGAGLIIPEHPAQNEDHVCILMPIRLTE